MIIPIGIDCGMATLLKKYNLRSFSFPFDWIVTYDGVSQCFKNNFMDFIPENHEQTNNYSMFFMHDFLDRPHTDEIKYKRRIERLQSILESNDSLIFVRKGHFSYHHEVAVKIKNDIEDAEDLDMYLREKYPDLTYKIITILMCGRCFNSEKTYSTCDSVKLYNIASLKIDDDRFEELFCKIFDIK